MVETFKRLGDLLLEKQLITPEKLDEALQSQQKMGDRLGHILLCMRFLKPLALYQALAEQGATPFADLVQAPVDPTLSRTEDLIYYLSYRCIPWRREGDYLILACTELTPKLKHWAAAYFNEPIKLAITTPRDVLYALGQCFGEHIDGETRHKLLQIAPEFSAYHTLSASQRVALIMLVALMGAAAWLAPHPALITLLLAANMFYVGSIGLKWLLYLRRKQAILSSPPPVPHEDDPELPIYTILVPLYHEKDIIPHLISALDALDYPKTRLDVKLIVETDDEMTIEALKAAEPPEYMEMLRVPYSLPRTKPKACNYALTFAKGEFVTIYDAEDRPEPSQLRKALAAFAAAPDDVACLQARLNYYNHADNWLTRLFAIEYSCLFDFMLPGLQAIGIPIPLGGTSNHIRLKHLRELGEWDPYNVTEDADLGMRLAIRGYKTRVLDSITLEESPTRLWTWIKQRSRWIKGYLQTWLVYMRSPHALWKAVGNRGFWGFQFFIGGPPAVFLLSPMLWLLCAAWFGGYLKDLPQPDWMITLCFGTLGLGLISHWWFAAAAVRHWRWRGMLISIFFFPLYWILHSLASYRALWQLAFRPHFWDKTRHGTSRSLRKFMSTKP